MRLELLACQIYIDAILDALSVEIAIRGVAVVRQYRGGALGLPELAGPPPQPSAGPDDGRRRRQPGVRVIIDRWLLQLVQDFIESTQPADVRAFIEEAIVTYIDRLAATGPP